MSTEGGERGDRAARDVELKDVYAPPAVDAPARADERAPALPDAGNYWLGFAIGFFGGCIALMVTRNAKSETRRGVGTGFVVAMGLGILLRIIEGVSRPGH